MTLLKPMSGDLAELHRHGSLRELYQHLLSSEKEEAAQAAATFLQQQLAAVEDVATGLPPDAQQLAHWVEQNCVAVAAEYADYLEQRKQGAVRRYFHNKAHALHTLRSVAPTKLVDGAWLYGVLEHWQDYRYNGLITTYLEELGDGHGAQNHVAIYRRLLAEHDCESDQGLADEHFHQGAIQLALGCCASDFMPEVLGYNLGYEQLPLHLLVCAYELIELGIDPYYFSLHVTIDNASTGHARRAVVAVSELMPVGMDPQLYWTRVARGYALNDLGTSTTAVIQAFDLEQELLAMLERKRPFGQHMHSDYASFEGKTVNQWLSEPGQMPGFLRALQGKGWIQRHQDPANSRFWQLIDGPGAAMFGVFSGFEKQLIHDWIAGDWHDGRRRCARRRISNVAGVELPEDAETEALSASLKGQPADAQIALLLPWLGPQRHSRPAGLFATRRFIELRTRLR
ncbi:iron-containing redox enzyme family protein [Pseudomonas sp. V1]|uniref:iron-containing redox enzyme family protein n=1 Tax=Pseudomonas arcuscaelestis TaxID=2710591 RepID=UPI00193EC4C4|nr:iron-containing redox enzyme family protein [Pseudomonas arcuscaelestis]MBM3104042.1 iron-containing redox enzyme family protein [Pseudomonas arcuscaelestis]